MKKLAAGLLVTAALTVSSAVAAAPSVHSPTRHPHHITTSAQAVETWAESVADSRGGGTFAQVPFNVSFSADVRKGVPAGFFFSFKSLEETPVFLRAPIAFTVQITSEKTGKVVWTGKTPAIAPAEFASWKKFLTMKLTWDQKDSKGKRIAPGKYKANVIGPAVISYSLTEDGKLLKQKLRLDAVNRGGAAITVKAK